MALPIGNRRYSKVGNLRYVQRVLNSEAYGVNSFGEVVGYTQDQNLASRAFKYEPGGGGTMIDLNTYRSTTARRPPASTGR